MSERAGIHPFESEELAASVCGLPEDSESDAVEDALVNKYGITLDQYHDVVADLVSCLGFGISPLTDTPYIGFCNPEQTLWLYKREFKHFI